MLKRILAISLSALMLISSTGVSLATHFCMGRAVETKLSLGEAELDCGMEETQSCEHQTQLHRIPCCDNEYQSISHDENFSLSKLLISFELSLQAEIFRLFDWQPNFDKLLSTLNLFYPQPPLAQDLPILHQSFLL